MRLDGGLFFATADALEERIRALVRRRRARCTRVVLDLEGVDLVDSQGAAKLAEILDFTESIDVDLRLARVKPDGRRGAREDGVLGRIGTDRIHGNVHRAVEAQLAADRLVERAD